MRTPIFVVLITQVACLLPSCGEPDSTSGPQDGYDAVPQQETSPDAPTSSSPQLQITLNNDLVSKDALVTLFEPYDGVQRSVAPMELSNTGGGTLRIVGVAVASTPAGALRLEPVSSTALPSPISPAELEFGSPPLRLSVIFTPPQAASTVQAAIALSFEDPQTSAVDVFTFHLALSSAVPVAWLNPTIVDFGRTAAGQNYERPVSVLNVGDAPLTITGFSLTGHPDFGVEFRGQHWFVSEETASGIQLSPPLVVGPQQTEELIVSLSSTSSEPASATLVLNSNDTTHPQGVSVELRANQGPP